MYETTVPSALGSALKVLPRDRAWDVVQNATLEMCGKWADLPPERKTAAYFMKIVQRRTQDELRRLKRENMTDVAFHEDGEGRMELRYPELVARSPMAVAEARIDVELLQRFAQSLPRQRARVWTLWWEEGLPPVEIAEELGISPVTVRLQLQKARSSVLELLEGGAGSLSYAAPRRTLPANRAEVSDD